MKLIKAYLNNRIQIINYNYISTFYSPLGYTSGLKFSVNIMYNIQKQYTKVYNIKICKILLFIDNIKNV